MSITKKIREAQKTQTSGRKFQRKSVDYTPAEWGGQDPIDILTTIAIITRAGGAIRFGYTADGGAYAIGVYGDGEKPYTEYVRPSEDLKAVLSDLRAAFDDGETTVIESERTAGSKSAPTAAQKLARALEEDRAEDSAARRNKGTKNDK